MPRWCRDLHDQLCVIFQSVGPQKRKVQVSLAVQITRYSLGKLHSLVHCPLPVESVVWPRTTGPSTGTEAGVQISMQKTRRQTYGCGLSGVSRD